MSLDTDDDITKPVIVRFWNALFASGWKAMLASAIRSSLVASGAFKHAHEHQLDAAATECVNLMAAKLVHDDQHHYGRVASDTALPSLWHLILLLALLAVMLRRRLLQQPVQTEEDDDSSTRSVEVLALFSNPTLPQQAVSFGLRPLAFGQDLKVLMHALPHAELEVEPAATLLNAHQALIACQPRYLLFSGHTIMGALAFETPEGRLDTHAAPEYFVSLLAGLARASKASSRKTARRTATRVGTRSLSLDQVSTRMNYSPNPHS